MSETIAFRCGFIAVVGRANVGKSTLMNHLIEHKVSITSNKPQTTRHAIRGIYSNAVAQFIFVDTPGFQLASHGTLNRHTREVLKGVDCALMVIEAMRLSDEDKAVMRLLPKTLPVILVVNKSDKVRERLRLMDFVEDCQTQFHFCATQVVSAKHHRELDALKKTISNYLPISPPLYDVGMVTDQSQSFLVGEIVSEKLFRYFGKEIPYIASVIVEQFIKSAPLYRIHVAILVNKVSQRRMLIGRAGEKLKKIATESRQDMEKLLHYQVALKIWVKVRAEKDHAK